MSAARPARRVRFGAFQLDLRARELRMNGVKVRVPEQSIQVLAMLLETPGEVITREELHQRLWPNGTIVEFDAGINAAIKRLRQALQDSAEEPTFVETLPRRGYRFLVPAEIVEPAETVPSADSGGDGPLGQTVSHYHVLRKLGQGAMGVVYQAEDIRLGRQVALKFLPAELIDSAQARQRFEREARAASTLNHPNICTIHEVEEHNGQPFIVMELLEGQTLDERLGSFAIQAGPGFESGGAKPPSPSWTALPVDEVLNLSMQIAAGLEAAHSKGIIHRDIKPANIFITTRGQAKILDFGVAKLIEIGEGGTHLFDDTEHPPFQMRKAPSPLPDASSASKHRLTLEGAAIGTAAYMSPEQIRGERLDARTDLFSFGLVLYEMTTGQPAFAGSTIAAVHDVILHAPPKPPRESNPDLFPGLEEIIGKALEKDRELRYQDTVQMLADLKRLNRVRDLSRGGEATGAVVPAAPVERRQEARARAGEKWVLHRHWQYAAIGMALICAAILAFSFRPTVPPPKITGSTALTNDGREKELFVTDGSRIYYGSISGSRSSLFQVSTKGGDSVPFEAPIPGPQISNISPDGSELLLTSHNDLDLSLYNLWIVPVLGHSPRRLANIRASDPSDAAWSPDGNELVYAQGSSIYRVKVDGTDSKKVVTIASGGEVNWIRWSPEGGRLRFTLCRSGGEELWEVASDGRNLQPVLPTWSRPGSECCGVWTPDGKYFVFQADRGGTANIWAIREKEEYYRKVKHEPVQLTSGPTSTRQPVPSTDGKKLFVQTVDIRGELVRYDTVAHQFVPYLSGISAMGVNVSPDGKWVVYADYPQGTLWRSKVDGSERLQLTFPSLFTLGGQWSPDGTRIAYMAQEEGNPMFNVYVTSADGATVEKETSAKYGSVLGGWSPDGNSLLIGRFSKRDSLAGTVVIEILDLRTHASREIPEAEGLSSPQWSPDGRRICAFSHATDRLLLFDFQTRKVTELAKTKPGAGNLVWSGSGAYVYFLGTPLSAETEGIFRVRVRDGKLEETVGLRNFRQATAWGSWTGLGPGDSPLLIRDIGAQEIYALDWEAP